MKKKIANYLIHKLLKRKRNFVEEFLINTISLFYPKRMKGLRESLNELLSKQRIAIIVSSDFEPNLYTLLQDADHWVKYELIKAFGKGGYPVTNTDIDPDIVIHLFGAPIKLPKSAYKIIWIYSHPDKVNPKVLRQYDKIFCVGCLCVNA